MILGLTNSLFVSWQDWFNFEKVIWLLLRDVIRRSIVELNNLVVYVFQVSIFMWDIEHEKNVGKKASECNYHKL